MNENVLLVIIDMNKNKYMAYEIKSYQSKKIERNTIYVQRCGVLGLKKINSMYFTC